MAQCVMQWVVINNVIITCITGGQVPNDLWQEFLSEMRKKRVTRHLGMSLAQSTLTSVQRKQAGEIANAQNIVSAVVTDDGLVRGILTALSWLGVDIKGFSWSQFDDAVKYLKVDHDMEERVTSAALELKKRLEQLTPRQGKY